jgi:hypothetical protein
MAMTSIGTTVPAETAYGQIVNTAEVEEITIASTKSMDTERIVREYFSDIPVMIQIARCESTFRHTLEDGSVLKGKVDSADTGVMQINKRYHEQTAAAMSLNLDDIYHNMAYARHLYEKQGTQPWSASAPCWNSTLAMNI